jgi:hypothetical protein
MFDMQPLNPFLNRFCAIGLALVLPGCASVLNLEDDMPPPPAPRELRQLSVPKDLAGNRPDRVTLNSEAAQPPKLAVPPAPSALMAPPVAPEPVKEVTKEADPNFNPRLFAPYLPSVKEGSAPNKWQKQPVHDFPWIPGAEPTRVNEETVVGSGEQMLGRLYAKVQFDRKPEPPPAPPVVVTPVPAKEAAPLKEKESRKNKKGRPVEEPPVQPVQPAQAPKDAVAAMPLPVICESVTCLDAARDALVEDARVKGWDMLLNRRVSMHQSFQFIRQGRVIWIELNLVTPRELAIEYSLMPEQPGSAKK